MINPARPGKHPRVIVLLLLASIVLAVGLGIYIIDASFRDDGRILAPGLAISVPVLWIIAGLLVSKLPGVAIALYAVAAILLFFEREEYRGFLAFGIVSLLLAAIACWNWLRADSVARRKTNLEQ